MSFKTKEEKLRDLLFSDYQFTIPRNQRNYVWDEKQWKDLLGDIMYIDRIKSSDNSVEHFFGTFVLREKEENKYEVIDGQQRITTVILILASICYLLCEYKDENQYNNTYRYLEGSDKDAKKFFKLENNELYNIRKILYYLKDYKEIGVGNNYIDEIKFVTSKVSDEKIKRCFIFFNEQLNDICDSKEKLIDLRNILLDMKFIHISSDKEIDCYDIFEILNARGINLEESELLKNFIFKYAQPEYNFDDSKKKWQEIENNIQKSYPKDMSKGMKKFLKIIACCKFGTSVKDDELFYKFKEVISKDSVAQFLDELITASEEYLKINGYDIENEKEMMDTIESFKKLGIEVFNPLLLSALLAMKIDKITKMQLNKLLKYLKNFGVIYIISGRLSHTIATKIHTWAKEIQIIDFDYVFNEIKEKTFKFYPSYDDFERSFLNLEYSNKNQHTKDSKTRKKIRYILEEIENYYHTTNEISCDFDKCTIEHLKNDSELDEITWKLGNLLLISSDINEELGVKNFEEKKEILKKSQMQAAIQFVKKYNSYKEWEKDEIINRTKELAKIGYERIWSIG